MSFLDLHDPATRAFKLAKRQHLNSTRARDPALEAEWSAFRVAEKKYKTKFPPPNLNSVLDLALLDSARSHEVSRGGWAGRTDAVQFVQLSNSPGYAIPSIPGLVILPSFLTPSKQKEIVRWSLNHQAKCNETNLHTHYTLPDSGLWDAHLQALNDPSNDLLVQPRADSSLASEASGPRQLINNEPASVTTFQALSAVPKPAQAPSGSVQPTPASALMKKLRWANIGWFYHWGTKQYDFARGKAPIHDSVQGLCRRVVAAVDWETVFSTVDVDQIPPWDEWENDYEPDAGIVNFYQNKDTLMAHVDRSEVCETSPLVSISLGQAAIFLIGDSTRETAPTAILIRSGDVVVMSGPCRRAYHSVPRILEGTYPTICDDDDPLWKPYADYLSTTRINVNARQVFPKGFYPFEQDKQP